MSRLYIKKAGISTIQHKPRFGYRAYAVPVGGPLDLFNAVRARQLLGLTEDVPVIETFYNLLKLEVSKAVDVAMSGAAKTMLRNAQEVSAENVISLKKGDTLSIGQLGGGLITYLAFSHELDISARLGSRGSIQSLNESEPNLRRLKDGDILNLSSRIEKSKPTQSILKKRYVPSSITVRFMEGPEYYFLDRKSKAILESTSFEVTPDIGRMGCRLKGPLLTTESNQSLASRVTLPGTIQLTTAGNLLALQADAQTTGGYPRIMQLAAYDLSMLSQAIPGTKIRFKKIAATDATRLFEEASYLRGFLPNSY